MAAESGDSPDTSFGALDARWRDVREGLPDNLNLRMRRALSWLERAQQETEDDDAAFIFYWIAFNALYSTRSPEHREMSERRHFDAYFRRIVPLDDAGAVYNAIWERFTNSVRVLLENKYVFAPFWDYHNGLSQGRNWERTFDRDRREAQRALGSQDTATVLSVLFSRLYVLRNQLLHGGATWRGIVNRDQVRDGARIMAFLTPRFIGLMIDNPQVDWGDPAYPVVQG